MLVLIHRCTGEIDIYLLTRNLFLVDKKFKIKKSLYNKLFLLIHSESVHWINYYRRLTVNEA